MSNGNTDGNKEIVVESTSPNVLDKMYDYYTENYKYFLHKDQMKSLGIEPQTKNNYDSMNKKRIPSGKTFKPKAKRTFKTKVPIKLPQKVVYLKKEFEFLESKALDECANENKYYNKVERWISSHENLSQWEKQKIFGYRLPEKILEQIIDKTGNKIRLFGA